METSYELLQKQLKINRLTMVFLAVIMVAVVITCVVIMVNVMQLQDAIEQIGDVAQELSRVDWTSLSEDIGGMAQQVEQSLQAMGNVDFEALNQALLDRGLHKLALGHHYDDAVETFMMSLLFEGRISCFQPVTDLDRTGIIQIRPMLYIHEKTVDSFAARYGLPVIENRCPVDKTTKRAEIKKLIYDLSATYPDLKERIFGAMQRFPLPEWEPHGRYKRPKEQA